MMEKKLFNEHRWISFYKKISIVVHACAIIAPVLSYFYSYNTEPL